MLQSRFSTSSCNVFSQQSPAPRATFARSARDARGIIVLEKGPRLGNNPNTNAEGTKSSGRRVVAVAEKGGPVSTLDVCLVEVYGINH